MRAGGVTYTQKMKKTNQKNLTCLRVQALEHLKMQAHAQTHTRSPSSIFKRGLKTRKKEEGFRVKSGFHGRIPRLAVLHEAASR